MLKEKINKLLQRRFKMLFVLLGILFICYFTLPLAIALFPDKMNQPTVVFGISLTWLYTFLQIPLTWVLGWIYWYKAKQLDQEIQYILQEDIS